MIQTPSAESGRFYVEAVRPGWGIIVSAIYDILDTLPESHQLQLIDAKEKYGQLRLSFNRYPTNLEEVWNRLCRLADKLCEQCAYQGKLCNSMCHSWVKTLCPRCHIGRDISFEMIPAQPNRIQKYLISTLCVALQADSVHAAQLVLAQRFGWRPKNINRIWREYDLDSIYQ